MKNKKILSVIMLVVTLLMLFVPFMALNVGASYDEYGLEMHNNNYSGTRWRLDGGIPSELGFVEGYFDIILINDIGNTSYSYKNRVYFGYMYNYESGVLEPAADYISLYVSSGTVDLNTYRNIDLSSMNGYLLFNVLYMSDVRSNIANFNTIFKTYLKLVYVSNDNNIPLKFIIESDYPSEIDISNFFLYFGGDLPLDVSGKILNDDFVNGNTDFVLNTSLCPPIYDIENEYYYYSLRTRYTGYIPYISFYDYEGNFIDRVELDGQYSEIYLTSKQYGVITFEYRDGATPVVTSIRLVLRDEDYGSILTEYYDNGYDLGENVGYNAGYDQGLNDDLGKDVVIGFLSAPRDFLGNIVLFEVAGIPISIWSIFTTILGVTLFIWFLKLFAGG